VRLKYFELGEFECKCGLCRINDMNMEFLFRLDRARELAGVPFKINSGFRCLTHNTNVGSLPTSSHRRGLAVDIRATDNYTRHRILKALYQVGFTRIGIGPTFIHVDWDLNKPQDMTWLYN
jgi:uncharacterized protein YcbK (DUF882 family)